MSTPIAQRLEQDAPPAAAATGQTTIIGECEVDGWVTAASFTPAAAITGAAGNYRKIAVVNKGQDGTGTAEVAALTFTAGTNAAAADETTLTLASAKPTVAAHDVLALVETITGTGLASPGGVVQVEVARSS